MRNSILLTSALLLVPVALASQTGGPGQPEFMQFKPATASDLVNTSNGSFSYNIPLFDVGGYPVNLSYQSGVQMEDVASVVGLGWNINIGAVTHTMRGLPDDFKGDLVIRKIEMRPNISYGGNVGLGVEFAGIPLHAKAGFGIFYNNYNGYGVEQSYGLSFSMHNKANTVKGGIGLGMKANSQSGVDIYAQPTVSMQLQKSSDMATNGSLGGLISVNSREGLKGSINASVDLSQRAEYNVKTVVRDAKGDPVKDEKGNDTYKTEEKAMSETMRSVSASYSFSKTPEIPRVSYPFITESYAGSFKAGGELWFMFLDGELKGYYSSQKLATHEITTPAYGFLYSDQAPSGSENILHDFTREKDQPYIKDASINIGIPSYTNDIYSVNAQGISGSFQLNRGDIGVIFDNRVASGGSAANIGIEIGFGNATHVGADISTTTTSSSSGKWSSAITPELAFQTALPNALYQPAYFKNASDVSVDENNLFGKLLGDRAAAVKVEDTPWWKTQVNTESQLVDDAGGWMPVNAATYLKDQRDPRTVNIQYQTAEIAQQFGLNRTIDDYQVNNFGCNNILHRFSRVDGAVRRAHHISQITSTNTDGMRYVFGLPTYNIVQKEVSFTLEANQPPGTDGLVTYNPDATWGENGRDGFYESTELPPYVTSHLLTAVLSPEYIDVDGNGPSLSDVGNYVKFNYTRAGVYKWRTPYAERKATFNGALLSDDLDNKGSYVYGEKELYYTHSIESKTQIAEFYYDVNGRKDGLGVKGELGGMDPNGKLYKLDSIRVYSINERVLKGSQAVPIRIIRFTYDPQYPLCPGINNSATGTGKLTLKKVSFASGKSSQEVLSPYVFGYGLMQNNTVVNPSYDAVAANRWGYYQKNLGPLNVQAGTPLSNIDYPYASQDETEMTKNAYAWNLTNIRLPGGGSITVQYEPQHYAYTQNRRCMEMFAIEATGTSEQDLSGDGIDNTYYFKFKLKAPITGVDPDRQVFSRYLDNDINQWYYYKALVNLTGGYWDWVSGYCKIERVGVIGPGPSYNHAYIKVHSVCRDDKGCGAAVNPIAKNAWQFMRMNRPEICYGPVPPMTAGSLEGFLKQGSLNHNVSKQISAFFQGFNNYAQSEHFATTLAPGKSFFRLYSPDRNKIMGGSRVRRIITDDNWKQETGGASDSKSYTIDYDYTDVQKNSVTGLPDTVSTGVVEYEPFNGQDENPMRMPVFIDQHIKMAPDNHLFVETPFNESLFPASNLTYAKVRVTANRTALHVPGAGYQEMEYYTARDYPVATDLTYLGSNHEKKTGFLASFAMSILGISESHDYVTLSQGACIILNDMHGKEKETRNYNNNGALISSERSEYSLGGPLDLIDHTDAVYRSDKLGVSVSAICDSRTTEHSTEVAGVNLNVDFTILAIIPTILAVPMPNMSVENSRLNTVALNKIIYKKGILTKKTVTENGASVSTENMLFDDKTGFVVLSKTTNEFNDTLYKLHYPADWVYAGLSAGYVSSDLDFTVTSAAPANYYTVLPHIYNALAVGDEIIIPTTGARYWVMDKVGSNRVHLEAAVVGTPVVIPSTLICRVLRPGRRNQLMLEAGSVVTHVNPIRNGHIDLSEAGANAQVINATMQEFTDTRIPYCPCETPAPPSCEATDPPNGPGIAIPVDPNHQK